MSNAYVGVQMVSAPSPLIVEGKKVARRPHTTCGHRREDQEDGSEAGTYTVEEKSERQTKVKLESLERRLRANEKARKEVEEELEKWKSRAIRAESSHPELSTKLAEMTKTMEEFKERSQDLEAKNKIHKEDRQKSLEKADESEKKLEEMCCHIASLIVEDQDELELIKHSPSDVFNKIKELLAHWRSLQEENKSLLDQAKKSEERLDKTRSQLERMGHEMQLLKRQDVERRDEQLFELHFNNETSEELKQNIQRMETSATQYQLEMDMLRAEVRCLKSRNHELEQSTRSLNVLMRSADSERKAFLETLAALLGQEDSNEQEIKRSVRTVISELERIKTDNIKQEEAVKNKEEALLNQAKQLRNALFRARTAEEEVSVINEKLQTAEQEILAAEMELKAAQKRAEELEEVIQQLGELLDIQGESQLSALIKRVTELVKFELAYASLFEGKAANDLRFLHMGAPDLRQIEQLRKRLKAAESHGALGVKKASEILDKQLLTKVTLDTIKAADTQKVVLQYKLGEQEKKIRNLEKEKREAEKLKNIVSKWEKKDSQSRKSRGKAEKLPEASS